MLERWKRASLRVHLIIQFSIALAAILIVFLYVSTQTLNSTIQDALHERSVLAQLIAQDMDTQLNHAVEILSSGLASKQLNLEDNNLEPEKDLLASLYEHSIFFKRIILLDRSGKALWLAPFEERLVGVDFSEPPYNRNVSAVSEPTFFSSMGRRSQTPGLSLVVPIRDSRAEVVGYFLGWIDFGDPHSNSLLYPYVPGSRGVTDLVDYGGVVYASTDPTRMGQMSDHAGRFTQLIQAKQATVGACHSCHSTNSISRQNDVLAFAPLTRIPFGVALRQPEDEVVSNSVAMTQRLVVLGAVVLAAFLGLIWFTTRGAIRPLNMLTEACQQIASGDLSHPIPTSGTAETAALARSFEEMRQDLLHYKQEMEASQHNLEVRVEERTAELMQYRDYLVKTNRNLAALNAVSATLVHRLDLQKTLDVVLERVVDAMAADAAGIYLLDEVENQLVLTAHHGLDSHECALIQRARRADLFSREELAPGPNNSSWRIACQSFLAKRFETGTVLCASLEEKGRLLGELWVMARQPAHLTSEDEELLNSIGWQIAMAVRNARLYQAVQRKEQEHSEMLHQVIAAQEEERKRIARELHDETSQGLATLMLGLDTLDAALAADPQEAAELQRTNKAIARQMLDSIRRITTDLRPSLLDDMGLVPAVAWYGEKRLSPLGIGLHLDGVGLDGRRLPPDQEIALFRVVQEAITNVIRHANASAVTVHLGQVDGHVLAEISDDGKGFDPESLRRIDSQGKGLGVLGMQERVNLLGGDLQIRTAPGQGTSVHVRIPLREVK